MTAESAVLEPPAAVTISASAARQIAKVLRAEETPGLKLRIAVSGGGCSGFQYGFTFDDVVSADDRLFVEGDAAVLIDETSLDLLAGSVIDFVEDLAGAAFQIRNPNAKSACGCGNSFSPV